MIKRTLAMMLVGLMVCALVSVQKVSAGTKADKQAKFSEKVRAGILRLGLGPDAIVKVKLQDKSQLRGYISQANDTGFVVADEKTGSLVAVAYPDVVKVQGNNLSTGAKIGIGIAIGFALTVAVIFLIKG